MGVVRDVPKYRYSSTRSASDGRRETIARARARGPGTGARDRVLLRVVFVSGNDAFVCVRCVRPIEIWFRLD
jgi:hypothetical protein